MCENKRMKILFVSAEVAPYAKTGGLADVAGSLPQTLAAMGHDVRVVMPRYKLINAEMSYVCDFPVQVDWRKETCIIRETTLNYCDGENCGMLPVYFIDSYHYFDRDGIYCYFDDADRFAFFCRSILEMLPKIGFQPDIIHLNDWHVGPVSMLLEEEYRKHSFYKVIATLFTIHNLEYQGNFPKDVLKLFNMSQGIFTQDKVEFYGMFSFMKAGIVYSNIINTVSETYAKEIQTLEYGEKMEGLLKTRKKDVYGIVNGISYETFSPSKDPRIVKNFNAETYRDKKVNKAALQKELHLPQRDVPLIGLISRLAGQKGLDLIMEVMDKIIQHDLQFVLLGKGDPYFEDYFSKAMVKYPEKFNANIGFDASLAQRIYAGSDIFFMPSRFEPCGLGQMISLRYGTIPVVRATGGLADTVVDYDEDPRNGNGFVFKDISSQEMLGALERALKLYESKTVEWDELVKKALNLDFSWHRPAQKYLEIYQTAVHKQIRTIHPEELEDE